VYGLVCRELLPVGMLGMLVAAIFSATMSSLSSDYNAVASVLTTDIYKRLFATSAGERDCVLAGRAFTLIVGLITMELALWMVVVGEELSLFDMMVAIFVVLGPPTSIPVIVGLMSRQVSNAGAICGMVTGMIVSLVARFWGLSVLQALAPFLEPLLGRSIAVDAIPEPAHVITAIAATCGGILVGTLLMPGSAEQRQRVRRFLDNMRALPAAPEPALTAPTRQPSPAAIVGIAIGVLGAILFAVVLLMVPPGQSALSLGVGASMLALGCLLFALPRLLGGQRST
jgi:Na+/proline symporter